MSNKTIEQLNTELANASITEALTAVAKEFAGQKVAFSTSLGLEDQVITDIIFKNNLDIEVFTLDTQRIFPETETLINDTEAKYGKTITRFLPQPEAVEIYIEEVGLNGFYESIENRKRCCGIRKIEPLNRALADVAVWITGLRQEQSQFRSGVALFETDNDRNIIKFNPLANWSTDDLWQHIEANEVPYNSLHKKGYPSIGCEPCTRAIKPGEDERAGRWWWENQDATKQECGLHISGLKNDN